MAVKLQITDTRECSGGKKTLFEFFIEEKPCYAMYICLTK